MIDYNTLSKNTPKQDVLGVKWYKYDIKYLLKPFKSVLNRFKRSLIDDLDVEI